MIEIPVHLVHFTIRQIREQSKTKPTVTNDIKLYSSERRQLLYISGYIVSKLYQIILFKVTSTLTSYKR